MAGIMGKIGDALHIGGDKKEGEAHKTEVKHGETAHKTEVKHGEGEHKEGFMDKIKDKIPGGEKHSEGGEKKKKKEKKKKEDGHDSSSSSDSD
ncbi:hypothetical protein ACHQM5_013263 [Ranunculus cassubicifolius]